MINRDLHSKLTTVFVATAYYRDSDPLFSVAGFDAADVREKALQLMTENEKRDADESDEGIPTEICWSGVHPWAGKEALPDGCLGIPAENLAELLADGITVY